jgi:hypothetical protein
VLRVERGLRGERLRDPDADEHANSDSNEHRDANANND